MGTNSQKKKLITLDVEKYDHVNHVIAAGELRGSVVRKVLKTLDKCHYVWTNTEINIVSENIGLITASLPTMVFCSVGSILNSALVKPLGRAIGIKGLRCKDEDHEEDHEEDHDCDSDCGSDCDSDYEDDDDNVSADDDNVSADDDNVSADDDNVSADDDNVSTDHEEDNISTDDEEDNVSTDHEDYGCKKKKKNWLGMLWSGVKDAYSKNVKSKKY